MASEESDLDVRVLSRVRFHSFAATKKTRTNNHKSICMLSELIANRRFGRFDFWIPPFFLMNLYLLYVM